MDEVMRWKSLLVCTCLIRFVTHFNAKSRTISSAHCTIYIINPVLFRCFFLFCCCFDFIFLATFCRICIRMQTKKATPNWLPLKLWNIPYNLFFPFQCIQMAPQSQIALFQYVYLRFIVWIWFDAGFWHFSKFKPLMKNPWYFCGCLNWHICNKKKPTKKLWNWSTSQSTTATIVSVKCLPKVHIYI